MLHSIGLSFSATALVVVPVVVVAIAIGLSVTLPVLGSLNKIRGEEVHKPDDRAAAVSEGEHLRPP